MYSRNEDVNIPHIIRHPPLSANVNCLYPSSVESFIVGYYRTNHDNHVSTIDCKHLTSFVHPQAKELLAEQGSLYSTLKEYKV